MDAQHMENDAEHQQIQTNLKIVPDQLHHPHNRNTQGIVQNPTVQLTIMDADNMEEYVRKHSDIGLDWNVPNLVNTCVIDLIRNRVQINPGENKLVFNSPELSEFFTRSCYELDLQSRRVHTYSLPPEDIGVKCQQEEFNLTLLREHFQKHLDQTEPPTDELKRIPLIRKKASAAASWT